MYFGLLFMFICHYMLKAFVQVYVDTELFTKLVYISLLQPQVVIEPEAIISGTGYFEQEIQASHMTCIQYSARSSVTDTHVTRVLS
jgi:hypothetical protein